ncbi:Zn-dependent protease with chaperone function [Cupriavidus necator]|uniref:M48 family peptidase n=1 Tax=Cupriavidus necator (strain ATCC 17699 / DSM 428 / KCTC 22496 / NCIMB 10442 / H16 / Stanier 337) TaxID=381666 RepID=Q0K882_CUPNH|nr:MULTISPECIES: M48 family metallopeptidase [Cupriavidus]EON17049.1 M48 family peptidase [Cupriavidus sp. GA3-3]KUE90441.1 peptidase M48 [Cupriavidus necator]QCC01567.1 M48 family peptidase [Cupriavidus necator H16]QQB75603.1 M48 family metallopeptidase [Cupriavidus necator]WKA39958.1 M48 family metallopeptidase [Cupriavidus necator]
MFTIVFLAALVLMVLTRLWLAARQVRHVAQHRNAVPPRFADTISLASHQKAADYTIARTRLSMLEVLAGAAVLIGFTMLGGLQWLNQSWLDTFGPGYAYGVALVASVALIGGLVDLPFSLYGQFGIEQRFGFNKMTFGLWLADMAKMLVVACALGLPLLLAVLWLMERAGSLWWVWTWLVWMAFNLFLLVVFPTFIAPLFNKFEPLTDESLRQRIEALMKRCGFASKGLFVMDGSKRSAHGNAYFTGFGAAKRIVFFDTLLERLSGDEIEAVLAHELGHFKRRHVTKRIVVTFALSLVFLALLGWLATRSWFYTGLGVVPNLGVSNNALALVLFFLALPVFTFLLGPLSSLSSRRHEFEADAFAADQTDAGNLVSALVKLYKDNASTLTPDPLYSAFYYSHPPAAQRIDRLLAHA